MTPFHLAVFATFAAAGVPLLAAWPAHAAEGEVRESVEVSLVTVDVWVTDGDGYPVKGLDAADFQILEDGKAVEIEHFLEIDGGAARSSGAEAAPDAPRVPSHLVVYLDRSRMHPASYQAALEDLAALIQSVGVEPENVLVLRQDRTLSIVSSLGSTREELSDAIQKLAAEAAGATELQNEVQLALDAIRAAWNQSRDLTGSSSDAFSPLPGNPTGGGIGGGGGSPREVVSSRGSDLGMGADACRTFFTQIQPILDAWSRERTQRAAVTLTHLSQITASLAGLQGVKSLLYFSDGLETQPGAALATYAAGLCPGRGTQLLSNAQSNDMNAAFLDLTRRAASSRVAIYAIETAGLRPGSFQGASSGSGAGQVGGIRAQGGFDAAHRINEREGLHLMARETGGRAVVDSSQLGPELQQIAADADNYYALAYPPPGAVARSGGEAVRERRIEVRVPEGMTARHRRGYVAQDVESWMMERVLGALNLGIADNPLEAKLGAGEVHEGEGGAYRLALHVLVPVERLAFTGPPESRTAELQVTVLARQLDTGTLVRRDQSYRLRGGPQASGFADLPIELQIEGGIHVTAVGVRDAGSREASFISTTLQVGGGG